MIAARMFRHSIRYWDSKDADIDNLDPLVRLLIEACAVELYRIGNEINSAQEHMLEKLARLLTHLSEVKRVLGKGGGAGKRLDFLMQELNREANTLGSKSVDAEMSQASMEMKVLIDQMREQIQNIE